MKLNAVYTITLLMLAFAWPAGGFCFDVSAQVDKTRITPADSVLLKIEIKGGKADLDMSVITDFKVMSRGTTSSYNYINGKSESSFSYQFILTPLSKGEVKIPPIKATKGNEQVFTKQIVITVKDEPMASGEVKDIFSKAEVSEKKPFVGQSCVYSLKFFTSRRLSGLGFETPPEFKEFSAKPFDKENNYTQNLDGVTFQVTEVNYLLFPAQPGVFTIDPAILVANVMVKSNRNSGVPSFFNDPFFSADSYTPLRVASNPVSLEVRPLPPYEGKNKFSGLVGRFSIQAELDKTFLKAGESATLTITLSGSGNIMDAGPPAVDMDQDAFKIYDDNPAETIELTQKGYEGEKIFKKALVPVNPGSYRIPAVSLVYFDTASASYQEISTQEISMSVTPSGDVRVVENQDTQSSANMPVVKKEVTMVNQDILEIKEGLEALEPFRQIRPAAFLLLIMAPAVLFSIISLFIRIRKKEDSFQKIMQDKAKRHFREASRMHCQDGELLSRLYSSLVAGVLSRAGKKGETLTLAEARSILEDTGAPPELTGEVSGLLEKIESARFGGKPINEKAAKALLAEVGRVIRMLCLIAVCLIFISGLPQSAAADPAADYINAVSQYKAGNFKDAAAMFEVLASDLKERPYLFYNTGNAFLKAGDLGRAVLWYERADRMIPGDPDLAFNLNYARSLVKDKNESSPDIFSILFFWDRWLPVFVIQGAAIFLSFLFFTWSALRQVQRKKIFSGFGLILCALFALVTLMVLVQYQQNAARLEAVIIQEEVAVRSGVSSTATQLFSLHAGTKVSVAEEREGYLKIRFSKDRVGWVKIGDALVI